jgi:hypothetical protein
VPAATAHLRAARVQPRRLRGKIARRCGLRAATGAAVELQFLHLLLPHICLVLLPLRTPLRLAAAGCQQPLQLVHPPAQRLRPLVCAHSVLLHLRLHGGDLASELSDLPERGLEHRLRHTIEGGSVDGGEMAIRERRPLRLGRRCR